jgi:hypothetical protein
MTRQTPKRPARTRLTEVAGTGKSDIDMADWSVLLGRPPPIRGRRLAIPSVLNSRIIRRT